MSSEIPKARDSHFYCFLSDYRARIFGSARLKLVFSEHPVSGWNFTNRRKSRARILKHGSRCLGESRILPFYTPRTVQESCWPVNTFYQGSPKGPKESSSTSHSLSPNPCHHASKKKIFDKITPHQSLPTLNISFSPSSLQFCPDFSLLPTFFGLFSLLIPFPPSLLSS